MNKPFYWCLNNNASLQMLDYNVCLHAHIHVKKGYTWMAKLIQKRPVHGAKLGWQNKVRQNISINDNL